MRQKNRAALYLRVSTADLSVREIQRRLGGKTGRGVVGDIVKRVRHEWAPDTARS